MLMDYSFCLVKFGEGVKKLKHHANVSGEYLNGVEMKLYKAGQYICTCCNKCNLQLSFNKKNYKLPAYFHNGSHYDFIFVMKLIASYTAIQDSREFDCLEVIPTSEDKEMQIEFRNIQFKDSLKLISSPLKTIVAQTLGNDSDHYAHTKSQLKQYCESKGKQWNNDYIDLLTRKEPMFYSLIKSYSSLNDIIIPTREEYYDDMKGEIMSQDEYDHMVKLWDTFDIKSWGEYYELYNVFDVNLMADSFEHFRNTTLSAFGVDPMHYITAPQMAYSLFLKVTMEGNHGEDALKTLGEKWAQYIMRIGANEGLSEDELQQTFIDCMDEFYRSGGIRLVMESEKDDFIRLLKNLRGDITQIVKRYSKIDIDNKEQTSTGIYYLDANNLYGGAMHRMMPYELVGVPQQEQVMERINQDPNNWVKSLKTFDSCGYFIECDIEAPKELHDKFNDLHSSLNKRLACIQTVSRNMLRRMRSWTK